MQARGQITIHNVYDGQSAEFYRLKAVREDAVVNAEGVLNATFRYEIEHVKGSTIITEKGKVGELYVSCTTNTNINVPISVGMKSEGTFRLENYIKAVNRPDYFTIELKSGNDVLEIRTIQVMMEAASYTKIVNDMRESVSTNGKDITTIKQDAKSISLIVDGLRTGVRNLLTGGKLEKTYHSYGYGNGNTHIKLKPNTTYTMTISGHISAESIANGQTLQAYIIADGWAWSAGGGNLEISSAKDTIKHYTFTTPNELPNDGVCVFDAYPTPNREPQGKNGEVTVNWITLTEGTQPEKAWIPAEGEDVYTQMSKAGMEIKDGEITLTADRTKIRNNKGEDIAVFNEDGTVDARRILMRCRFGNITFGEVDGYPNIILTNELGQPQVMLNHRGIVNKYGVDMELINASRYFVNKRDGKAYLGVNIIVKITNRGFQQNTYGGGDIKLTATLEDKSHEYITLQLGKQYTGDDKAIVAATTPITLKIGETGEMIYGGLFEIGSTSGGAVVAQKMSYSVRSVYYDTVIDKSYVSELGGNNFSSDSGGNLINPSNGDEPPAVIPAPNTDV